MWSTPSLPLLPGLLWPGVLAPDKVLSMAQTEQTVQINDWYKIVTVLLQYLKPFISVQERSPVRLAMLPTKSVYNAYMNLTYMYK